ncbi:ankyrin repeat domain-containing protein [Endozoicomonas euniceicola]|uniref:Ankyrin repeat domain-containing protein n=1 Tax=Endozoicomonas euniceicola TaxID=1234143 RepID=A0ABY6GWC3_9GAMM|nr:ankyrin repeat domain-containing protein [Endozoicomonas euniceicola]UYM16704.1 ankyrin repeat domain-containing protein [Endozoicomonas euniceicola]
MHNYLTSLSADFLRLFIIFLFASSALFAATDGVICKPISDLTAGFSGKAFLADSFLADRGQVCFKPVDDSRAVFSPFSDSLLFYFLSTVFSTAGSAGVVFSGRPGNVLSHNNPLQAESPSRTSFLKTLLKNRLLPDGAFSREANDRKRNRLEGELDQAIASWQRLVKRPSYPAAVVSVSDASMRVVITRDNILRSVSLVALYEKLLNMQAQSYLALLDTEALKDIAGIVTGSLVASGSGGDGDDDDNDSTHYTFDAEPEPLIIAYGDKEYPEQDSAKELNRKNLENKRQLLKILRKKMQQAIVRGHGDLARILDNRIMLIAADLEYLTDLDTSATGITENDQGSPGILSFLKASLATDDRELWQRDDDALKQSLSQHQVNTDYQSILIVPGELTHEEALFYDRWRLTDAGLVYQALRRRLEQQLQLETDDISVSTKQTEFLVSGLETLVRQFRGMLSADLSSQYDERQVPHQEGGGQNQKKSKASSSEAAGSQEGSNSNARKNKASRDNKSESGWKKGDEGEEPPDNDKHTYSKTIDCPSCHGPCEEEKPEAGISVAGGRSTAAEGNEKLQGDKCSICKDDLGAISVVKTNCNHQYHLECIAGWLREQAPATALASPSCAYCRQQALPLVRVDGGMLYEDSEFCEDLPLQACRAGDLKTLQRSLELDSRIANKQFRSAVSGFGISLLYAAVLNGHTECLQPLIDAGAVVGAALWEDGHTLLHIAAHKGYTECLKVLIKAGADVKATLTTDGATPLHFAAQDGHTGCVELLIKAGAIVDAAWTVDGVTPLHLAAQGGHIGCMELLIKAGADVGADQTVDGVTPLHLAAQGGHIGCMELLIKAGADVKATLTTNGATPLHIAAQVGHTECMKLLIKAGADVKAALTTNGDTPLHLAAQGGHIECMKLLIKAGADVGADQAVDGATPLHFAAQVGHTECMELLIKAGAAVDAALTTFGGTPLHFAAQGGHTGCVELLINAGAAVDAARTTFGDTPLHLAAENGHAGCVELLIKAGAAVDAARTTFGDTPLHLAAENGHAGCVELLIKAGAGVDAALTTDGSTPLHLAAENGHAGCVELLINAGAAVDAARTTDGITPLHIAAQGGHTGCVELLIKARAAVDATRTADGATPLHLATLKGRTGCVELLIKARAAVDAALTTFGGTPLHFAAQGGHTGCVELLIKAGAVVDAVLTKDGSTSLHLATQGGHTGCVELLIKAGAIVDAARTVDGVTPLHLAAQGGHIGCMELLIKAGADVGAAQTVDGATPLHLAALKGRTGCVKLLINAKADVKAALTTNGATPLRIANRNGHTGCAKLLTAAEEPDRE